VATNRQRLQPIMRFSGIELMIRGGIQGQQGMVALAASLIARPAAASSLLGGLLLLSCP
jgi:hypothetical protein